VVLGLRDDRAVAEAIKARVANVAPDREVVHAVDREDRRGRAHACELGPRGLLGNNRTMRGRERGIDGGACAVGLLAEGREDVAHGKLRRDIASSVSARAVAHDRETASAAGPEAARILVALAPAGIGQH